MIFACFLACRLLSAASASSPSPSPSASSFSFASALTDYESLYSLTGEASKTCASTGETFAVSITYDFTSVQSNIIDLLTRGLALVSSTTAACVSLTSSRRLEEMSFSSSMSTMASLSGTLSGTVTGDCTKVSSSANNLEGIGCIGASGCTGFVTVTGGCTTTTTSDGGGWPWWAWFLLMLLICCVLCCCCGLIVALTSYLFRERKATCAKPGEERPLLTRPVTTVPMAAAQVPTLSRIPTTGPVTTAVQVATFNRLPMTTMPRTVPYGSPVPLRQF